MSTAPLDLAQRQHFSPCLDAQHTCATCTHAIDMDGPHLWCQRTRIVVVMPCGSWEREPGTDA